MQAALFLPSALVSPAAFVSLATLGVRRFAEPGYRHGRRAGALLVGVSAGLQSSPALTAAGCSDA